MEKQLCCSYAATDEAWVSWADNVRSELCEPVSLGVAAADSAGSRALWLPLPGRLPEQARFVSRMNLERPELVDLCLQIRCSGQIRDWDDAWLRPERGCVWETVESCTPGPAGSWLIAVRASATGGKQLHMFSVREDGLVCLRAGAKRGTLLTKPILCTADTLLLNCATSAAGSVRVGILTQNGQPVCGRSIEDCDVIYGNGTDIPVTFRGKRALGNLAGHVIRLKFELQDAELYAFRFCAPKQGGTP